MKNINDKVLRTLLKIFKSNSYKMKNNFDFFKTIKKKKLEFNYILE